MTCPQPKWVDGLVPDDVEDLARRVMDAAYRVHRALGPGFREIIYRRCFVHALQKDGLEARVEAWLPVRFEDLTIERGVRADVIVNGRLLVELKAVESLHPLHASQVISYLKASGLPLGLLLNFNVPYLRQGFRRLVHPDIWRAEMQHPDAEEVQDNSA